MRRSPEVRGTPLTPRPLPGPRSEDPGPRRLLSLSWPRRQDQAHRCPRPTGGVSPITAGLFPRPPSCAAEAGFLVWKTALTLKQPFPLSDSRGWRHPGPSALRSPRAPAHLPQAGAHAPITLSHRELRRPL